MRHLSNLVWSTTAALALVVAMGAMSPAAAQPQVAAGYQFINASAGGSSTSIPAGWFADVAVPIGFPMLSVVGSVDGGYKSDNVVSGDSAKTHTILGGVRYSLPASGKMTPFAQVTFGVAHGSYDPGGAGTSTSSNEGAVDFGGGIDWGLNDKWTVRIGAGYRRIMSTPGVNNFRFVAGVVLPIGN